MLLTEYSGSVVRPHVESMLAAVQRHAGPQEVDRLSAPGEIPQPRELCDAEVWSCPPRGRSAAAEATEAPSEGDAAAETTEPPEEDEEDEDERQRRDLALARGYFVGAHESDVTIHAALPTTDSDEPCAATALESPRARGAPPVTRCEVGGLGLYAVVSRPTDPSKRARVDCCWRGAGGFDV